MNSVVKAQAEQSKADTQNTKGHFVRFTVLRQKSTVAQAAWEQGQCHCVERSTN